MNPNITKLIDQYLSGELGQEDANVFEQRMQENESLRTEVELQRSIYEAAKRATTRKQVRRTGQKFHLKVKLKWFGLTVGILVVATAAVLAIIRITDGDAKINDSVSEELIQKLDAQLQLDGIESQYFSISVEGEVVLSKDGILLSVPEKAFLLNGQPYHDQVVVQLQEALNASDILKAGLSTMSGDRLLETQGMMAIQGYTVDGQKLEFNPKVGVYVQVPVDEYKKDTQLFTGVKLANGVVDWQNPQALEKIPVSVDMSELNFYPQGFEEVLDAEKWKRDKRSRDSLYLSFDNQEFIVAAQGAISSRWPEIGSTPVFVDGELLFKKCQVCHDPHRDGTGPALSGVRQKWMELGAEPGLIYQWVRDWEKAASTSEFGSLVSKRKPTNMKKFPELSMDEINAIFDYVDGVPFGASVSADEAACAEISPSKVLGFWNQKFNHTNLATREFEKRMQAIFKTCNNQVLEKYTGQLDKSISEIDAQVVKMGYTEFERFAAEQVGKVQISNKHQQQLANFYKVAVAQYRSSADYARELERHRREKFDQDVVKKREIEQDRKLVREATSLHEEYQYNLKNVRKQLGKSVGFTLTHGGGTIVNVDKYVMDATIARKTTTITDPLTGKTTQLNYNSLVFEVAEPEKYQKLYAYLFPHQLNSYQRIIGKNGAFEYSLNDDILYDLAIVGMTEKGFAYFQKLTLNAGDFGEIQLEAISEKKLEASIRQLNANRILQSAGIQDELDWLFTERANYVEQEFRKDMVRFRIRLSQKVFPCGFEWDDRGEMEVLSDSTDVNFF